MDRAFKAYTCGAREQGDNVHGYLLGSLAVRIFMGARGDRVDSVWACHAVTVFRPERLQTENGAGSEDLKH